MGCWTNNTPALPVGTSESGTREVHGLSGTRLLNIDAVDTRRWTPTRQAHPPQASRVGNSDHRVCCVGCAAPSIHFAGVISSFNVTYRVDTDRPFPDTRNFGHSGSHLSIKLTNIFAYFLSGCSGNSLLSRTSGSLQQIEPGSLVPRPHTDSIPDYLPSVPIFVLGHALPSPTPQAPSHLFLSGVPISWPWDFSIQIDSWAMELAVGCLSSRRNLKHLLG